jgi:hypothetical protein
MKMNFVFAGLFSFSLLFGTASAQGTNPYAAQVKESAASTKVPAGSKLYLDVHHLGAGNVKFEGVADAHAKDLATQKKYHANFIKYWVDEDRGDVYCLVSAPDTQSIRKTHAEAHGLLPNQIYLVTDGPEAQLNAEKNFYLDFHEFGPGKVTAKDVAGAHQKDLATGPKYAVNWVNYWFNEKEGMVVCLSQAPDSASVIRAHKEAHGLVPIKVEKVKEGQ